MQNTRISELESLQPTALDAGLVFSGKESGRRLARILHKRVAVSAVF